MHWLDWTVLGLYFAAVLYFGVIVGGRRTKTLGDFLVAGGKWGPWVSFIFVFASAIAGNEAVVVARGGYEGGLSGVWYWWSFLFATPIYYAFATYYRRARVYNAAEFIAMRYGERLAGFYGLVAGTLCVLFIGMFLLAVGKILAGMMPIFEEPAANVQFHVWLIAIVVGVYVCAGGMMSTLINDIFQGLMCLLILGFVGLPFLWKESGGLPALRALPDETWSMTSPAMGLETVIALNVAALVGGIAAPWIYNWIAVSRDERAATQCGWGHLWKRVITLLFALYGIQFLIYQRNVLSVEAPELAAALHADPELGWGIVMQRILPPMFIGLLLASFFAAAMSSAGTYATTSSAMFVDFIYRRFVAKGRPASEYLKAARIWVGASILFAALLTLWLSSISQYIKFAFNLLSFLGIPIYFAVLWRRSNRLGAWCSLLAGSLGYLAVSVATALTENVSWLVAAERSFATTVFVSTAASLVGMLVGTWLGKREDDTRVRRFHVVLNTPVGDEARLVRAGIKLPALVDAGLVQPGAESIDEAELRRLDAQDAQEKILGPDSALELRHERKLPWYYRGMLRISLASIGLVVGTWLGTRLLFVW